MALSQCLEDSPLMRGSSSTDALQDFQDAYNERHRLALEELLSGGLGSFMDFLHKEKIPNFLSDKEVERVQGACVRPRCASVSVDADVSGSVSDLSSGTYFPDVSDLDPPVLELGWPGFTAGSYRGVTRAVAHFQPSPGARVYGCKDAARRLIRSAREVIAIVTDSLTDLDVFKDLQEASAGRSIPVYLLLDLSCASAFLQMCRNLGLNPDELRQMRVRTITGNTYFTRSGARITGRVHERFMLIDGNRVATGSYRFNWTDGKLNSSNLIELSGQISERFDEEFRILYAQSSPLSSSRPQSFRNSSTFDHLFLRPTSPFTPKQRPAEHLCVTSTPARMSRRTPLQSRSKGSVTSTTSTLGENMENDEEILAGSNQIPYPCHVSTQTSFFCPDPELQVPPESHDTSDQNQKSPQISRSKLLVDQNQKSPQIPQRKLLLDQNQKSPQIPQIKLLLDQNQKSPQIPQIKLLLDQNQKSPQIPQIKLLLDQNQKSPQIPQRKLLLDQESPQRKHVLEQNQKSPESKLLLEQNQKSPESNLLLNQKSPQTPVSQLLLDHDQKSPQSKHLLNQNQKSPQTPVSQLLLDHDQKSPQSKHLLNQNQKSPQTPRRNHLLDQNEKNPQTPVNKLLQDHAQKDQEIRECFYKLSKERQSHYSAIRSRLEHMVFAVSQRRELVDISNICSISRDPGVLHGPRAEQNMRGLPEGAGMGTWPRARCVH